MTRIRIKQLGLALVLLLGTSVLGACDSPFEGKGPGKGDSTSVQVPTLTLVNFDEAGNRLSRFDVDGDMIDVHDGEIRRFGDTYYWYGTSYDCGYEWKKLGYSPFCGFRVYTSPDLIHWTDRGPLFDVIDWEPWQARCHGWSYGCFRPHIAYNPATQRYVLWVNTYEASVNYHVLEGPTPLGPWTEHGTPTVAANRGARDGVNNGDHNLFVDDDGKGYLVYTDLNTSDLLVEELSPDFMTGTGRHVRLGLRHKEAPSMFKRGGRYYMTMSDPNCGYCTTGTSYITASHPLGPWTQPKKLTTTSCGGQPSHVSVLPAAGGGTWYMYQSDLWNNRDPNEATADQFWAPLEFDSAGEILPITCQPSYKAPVLVTVPVQADSTRAERWRLQCDVGTQGGLLQREVRFTPRTAGRLRSIAFGSWQRNFPSAPLNLEVRGGGQVLHRAELKPADIHQAPRPHNDLAWAPRTHRLATDVALSAGVEYAVRVHAPLTRGCYGVAFRDDRPLGDQKSFISRDGGSTWSEEPGRKIKLDLTIEAQ